MIYKWFCENRKCDRLICGSKKGENGFHYIFYYCYLGEEKADYTIPENCPERADPFFEIELKRFEMR